MYYTNPHTRYMSNNKTVMRSVRLTRREDRFLRRLAKIAKAETLSDFIKRCIFYRDKEEEK